MIRVVGNAPLWVDVWRTSTGAPIAVVLSSPTASKRMTADAASSLRIDLCRAEWFIEGDPQADQPFSLPVDRAGGFIEVLDQHIACIQSERLRALLVRAETVVRTGVGDMEPTT